MTLEEQTINWRIAEQKIKNGLRRIEKGNRDIEEALMIMREVNNANKKPKLTVIK